jgi:hypothetical protein
MLPREMRRAQERIVYTDGGEPCAFQEGIDTYASLQQYFPSLPMESAHASEYPIQYIAVPVMNFPQLQMHSYQPYARHPNTTKNAISYGIPSNNSLIGNRSTLYEENSRGPQGHFLMNRNHYHSSNR